MKFKKWFLYTTMGLLAGLFIMVLFNFFIDPFGIFGDKLLNWYGYNITMNPRIAKIGYLDKHHKNYDSYIIGSSKTSSVSPEQLNKYYDGSKFYNMLMYGADLKHIEQTAKYLIDNYEVKNIVLHLGISELMTYGDTSTDTKQELHAKVSGESLLKFYYKYLTLNPQYGIQKINAFMSENLKEKPTANDVFISETGVYNKTKRDKENVININDYVEEIGGGTFLEHPGLIGNLNGEKCIQSIMEIKKYCEENNVTFKMISGPNYEAELKSYDLASVKDYFVKLAEIDDYWNFSGYNSVSQDPRFFYDSLHYRNILGEMMIGKVFGDKDIYFPEDFGVYMTKANAAALSDLILTPNKDLTGLIESNEDKKEVKLPILMYHHITEDDTELNYSTTTAAKFKEDMIAIKEAGYNTITYEELIRFGSGDRLALPDSPVLVTFDDGYESNYTYAYKILKELGMKANINVIGWSVGLDKRPGTEEPIIEHFTLEELKEMEESTVIQFGNHSFDLHEDGTFPPYYRDGVLRKNDETLKQYDTLLVSDHEKFIDLGIDTKVFCYPYGKADVVSERILKELGYQMTLTTVPKMNTIICGKPDSLYGLNRFHISYEISSQDLVNMLR